MEKCEKHGKVFVKVHGIRWVNQKPLYEGDVEHKDQEWEECPMCLEDKLGNK